jgi:hypothetical protein
MIAAALSTLISPAITNKLTVIGMTPGDELRNNLAFYGVAGATTAFMYTLLTMALGVPEKA